eukprot:76622_1
MSPQSLLFAVYFYILFTTLCTYTNAWPSSNSKVQTFKNVKNGTITCGEDKDCTIICDEKKGCKGSTFNVQYGNIHIFCSGDTSCQHTKIISKHTLSLVMNFTGSSAFNGKYWGYGDENTTAYCHGGWSCSGAVFHYDSFSRTTHECDAMYTCSDTTIHALSDTNIICADADGSCYSMSVISATNNYTIKVSGTQYTFPSEPIYIFATSPTNLHNIIICDECKLDSILFVPAMSLNRTQGCYAWNTSCIATMIDVLHENAFTTVDNYYGTTEYSDTSGDILLIYSSIGGTRNAVFNSPTLNDENALFEVFCIECSGVSFNFTKTKSVVMRSTWRTTGQWMSASTIYGPTDRFTFVANLGWNYNKHNHVYVNNTDSIRIQDIGYMSAVYVGDATDVEVSCWGYDSCRGVNVSTALNPIENVLFGPNGAWNVNCASKESCEPGFAILFSFLNKLCPFTAAGPDTTKCPFLKPISINTTQDRGHSTTDNHHSHKGMHGIPVYVWVILACVVVLTALIVSGLLVWFKRKKRMQSQLYAQLNDDNKF